MFPSNSIVDEMPRLIVFWSVPGAIRTDGISPYVDDLIAERGWKFVVNEDIQRLAVSDALAVGKEI